MTVASFPPRVEALYARLYGPTTVAHLRAAAAEQDEQYRRGGGGVSHGWMAWQVATGLGLPATLATPVGDVLDAIQPALDLADNLADHELDRALGRDPDSRYPGVPHACLPSMPALMVGAGVAALYLTFADPAWSTADAVARLLGVFSRMNEAQGLPEDHPERNDGLSGEVGRLWLLPIWLLPADHPTRALLPALDAWAYACARTIQLGHDVVEHPDEPHRAVRHADACAAARAVWPAFAPFRPSDTLAASRLLVLPG